MTKAMLERYIDHSSTIKKLLLIHETPMSRIELLENFPSILTRAFIHLIFIKKITLVSCLSLNKLTSIYRDYNKTLR